jgi:hypothetical protein
VVATGYTDWARQLSLQAAAVHAIPTTAASLSRPNPRATISTYARPIDDAR